MRNMTDESGIPGSARAFACWLRRLAATDFAGDDQSHYCRFDSDSAPLEKFALARRHRQHAGARALPRTKRVARSVGP